MQSRAAIQSHTFWDVAKRQLGQPDRAPLDWQTHWWPSVVIHNSSAYGLSTCNPWAVCCGNVYSKGCGLSRVNKTRLRLSTRRKKTLKALSRTQAALYQHIRRAVVQAIIWNQATSVHMDIPDVKDWGWHKVNSGRWLPFWTTLEDNSKDCCILLQCCCAKSCRGNCKCSKAGVRCTGLCKCKGGCVNDEDDWFIYWFTDWLAIVIIVLISCFAVMNMLSKGTLVHSISVIFKKCPCISTEFA